MSSKMKMNKSETVPVTLENYKDGDDNLPVGNSSPSYSEGNDMGSLRWVTVFWFCPSGINLCSKSLSLQPSGQCLWKQAKW